MTKQAGQSEPIISVSQVSFSYGEKSVLENVEVNIPQNSVMAIIGPNGSGKTTLLKILLGLLKPEKGEVKVFGQSPEMVREQIAYVPQKFSLDETIPLTVKEFLRLSIKDYQEKDRSELDCFGVKSLLKAPLGKLSGGELQRVLLTRSFLQNPRILYLDEPETGIDIGGEYDFYEMIKHLHDKHQITIIFVSHEVDIVSRYATHVLCLNKKHLCFGNPKSVLNQQTITELYGTDVDFFDHKH